MKTIKAAAVQVCADLDREKNVSKALDIASRARSDGAEFICLPEMFACYGPAKEMVAQAEIIPGPTTHRLSEFAASSGCWLVGGSIFEKAAEGKVRNACPVFSPEGKLAAVYRKMHLFSINIPERVNYRESDFVIPGDQTVAVRAPFATVGLSICYDLRFPELYRNLMDQNCEVLCVPAAFAMETGRDHWGVLLAARAIENQSFVIAANQWGDHPRGLRSFGRSMIVDPWGVPLAVAQDGEGFCSAVLDAGRLAQVRGSLPALSHRRQWPPRAGACKGKRSESP
ncbi:MAG TPA: carbon-nitrogen hydrolase family protein [Candidatus Brocadiia bacterium]|nr:carbon-nitrogen hydrolase family protein [Candidatus Brocadiia bacterium]